jgi:hypothetical protein
VHVPPKPKIKVEKPVPVHVRVPKVRVEPPKVRMLLPDITPAKKNEVVTRSQTIVSEPVAVECEPAPVFVVPPVTAPASVVRRTTGVPQKLGRGRRTTEQEALEAKNRRDFYSRNKTQLGQLESMMRDRRR